MTHHCRYALLTVVTAALVASAWSPGASARASDTIPDHLTPQEFWRLTEDLSEPDGYFRSDNLLSNEVVFARVLPELTAAVKPNGVYLGVGPEQNFTYMAATRPRLAFILDIRRGNLHTQLLYKALFELSDDRADFVARLFSKERPEELSDDASVQELMDTYWAQPSADEMTFRKNLQDVFRVLTTKDGLPLSAEDREGIEHVYHAFYWYGPGITWSSSTSGTPGGRATYRDLMVQADEAGNYLSYLASRASFSYLKEMEQRNLVVPVVGNFAGPRALRAVGEYVRRRGAVVSVFYLSNVEQYLRQDGTWSAFCQNTATLPLNAQSVFVRPTGSGMRGFVTVIPMTPSQRLLQPQPSPRIDAGVVPIVPELRGCSAVEAPAAGR